MLFCPLCLQRDQTPFFRIEWRLLFSFLCVDHKVYLTDECIECGNQINLKIGCHERSNLKLCPYCMNDLSLQPTVPVHESDILIQSLFYECLYKVSDKSLRHIERRSFNQFFYMSYAMLRGMIVFPNREKRYQYSIKYELENLSPHERAGRLERVHHEDIRYLLSMIGEHFIELINSESLPAFFSQKPSYTKFAVNFKEHINMIDAYYG